MAAKFELYKDTKGEFRWRLVSSNGQTVAAGGQGYPSKHSAIVAIELLRKNAPTADIKKFDVFIAHASEDKNFVGPLAIALKNRGLNVWYDDFILKIGMSLRQEIDKGIAQSRYGVVVLSRAFFEKDWPQKELDGLSAKEGPHGRVILPIWHNIDQNGVSKHSPTLAGIIAAKSKDGIDSVVGKIIDVVTEQR